ncbi:hypothetical protein GMA1_34 [Gordonia phage GMA1]|uniref:hypothetical protein n=1 Tax=Gordonia phage GMA1 TaxID=1647470 RepID=UPI0007B622DB|nr:hypothetical protein BH788_gp34 [Gordonia phage GMA1]AKJ72131.1 hypothetical protein GMA1_34 [Gordonia phage GMA1]
MFENDTLAIAKVRQILAARLRTPTLCNVSDMGTPTQPEEARIIDHAQKTAVPAISMRKAAEMAGISDGRWRQIVKGYQGTGQGRIPVVAPSETVARMALVVGVTDSQLEDAGRTDAAEVLRKLLASSEQPDVELSTVPIDRLLGEVRRRVVGATPETSATQAEMDRMLRLMRQGRADEVPEGSINRLGDELRIERFLARYELLDMETKLKVADYASLLQRDIERRDRHDYQPDTEDSPATQPRAPRQADQDQKTRPAPVIKTRTVKPTDLSERRSRREAGSPVAEDLTPDDVREESPEDAIAARTRDPRFAPDDPAGYYGTNDIGEESQDPEDHE